MSPAVKNVIARDFHAASPNTKWLTDLTEFHIPAGKVYLSPIIDVFINELDLYLRWYNEKRIKLSLGGMSPITYRRGIGLAA